MNQCFIAFSMYKRMLIYCAVLFLYLEPTMDSGHAKCQVFIARANRLEALITNDLSKVSLRGEFADAFHEVLVGIPIIGNDLTQGRNHIKGVDVIESNKCDEYVSFHNTASSHTYFPITGLST